MEKGTKAIVVLVCLVAFLIGFVYGDYRADKAQEGDFECYRWQYADEKYGNDNFTTGELENLCRTIQSNSLIGFDEVGCHYDYNQELFNMRYVNRTDHKHIIAELDFVCISNINIKKI